MMTDSKEWGTDYCLNCGHPSHCGIKLYKEFRSVWDKHLGQIEVCKSCRCNKCANND
jgi:hypothetical protein